MARFLGDTQVKTPDTGMQSLDRNRDQLDVKSKSVTGEQPNKGFDFKRGIKGAEEAFLGGGKAALDPAIGAAKGVLSTIRGASSLGERLTKGVGRILTPKGLERKLGFAAPRRTAAEKLIPEELTEAKGGFQKAGKFIEQAAEFALPTPSKLRLGAGLASRSLGGAAKFGGISAAQEGKVGTGAVIGATIGAAAPLIGAGLKGAQKAFKAFSNPKVKASLSGLSEQDITAITRQSGVDKKVAREFLSTAKKAQVDRQATTPLQLVGKELAGFQKSASGKLSSVGKRIGQEVKRLKFDRKIINTEPIKKQFQRQLKQLGVRVKPDGALDFTGSQIEGISADQKVLDFAWNKVAKGKMNAGDMVNFYRNLGNRIFTGKAQQELSVSKTFANKVRRAVVDEVGKVSPALKKLNKQFTTLSDIEDKLIPLVGRGGEKAPQFVRRAFSNVGELPRRTFKDVDKLAKQFGIKDGKNILNKGDLALAAENAVGLARTTGLEGIISRTAGEGRAGLIRKSLQKAEQAVVGTPEQNFLNLISSPSAIKKAPAGKIKQLVTSLSKSKTAQDVVKGGLAQVGR